MIKKIMLLLLVILGLMCSGYSATEYLNSCGKSSGWTTGNTYILNFSTISQGYANDYCLKLNDPDNEDNIQIIGSNQSITSFKSGLKFFESSTSQIISGWNMTNINFVDTTGTATFMRLNTGDHRFNLWSNINFTGGQYFLSIRRAGGTTTLGSGSKAYIQDVFIVVNDDLFHLEESCATGGTSRLRSVIISDSVLISTGYGQYFAPVLCSGNQYFESSAWDNTVIYANTSQFNLSNTYFTNNGVKNSLIHGFSSVDSNNDNVADTDIYFNMTSMKMSLTLNGITFLQDTTEGFPFVTGNNKKYLSINPEVLVFAGGGGYYNTLGANNPLIYILDNLIYTSTISSIGLGSGGTLISFPSSENPTIVMSGNSVSAGDEKGHILLRNNALIENINFTLSKTGGFSNLFSNFDLQTVIINPTIINNTFDITVEYSSTTGHLAEFESLGLLVKDNEFVGSDDMHELFQVSDDGAIFTRNTFIALGQRYYLFDTGFNVNVFNNNISSNVSASGISSQPLNLNATTYYLLGNIVYVFNIGNYWQENTGCVDGNADGICDSPYVDTASGYTDYRPIVNYPFDFNSLLLTAQDSFIVSNFTVTLIAPINNSVTSVSTPSSSISFSYQHDSDIPNTDCTTYIDGSPVVTDIQVNANTTKTNQLGGWANQSYTYQVLCSNAFISSSSPIINFNVVVTGNGGGDGNNVTSNSPFSGLTGSSILDPNDITGSTDNIIGYVSDIGAFLLNIGIPALIIFVIIGAIMVVVTLIS